MSGGREVENDRGREGYRENRMERTEERGRERERQELTMDILCVVSVEQMLLNPLMLC